MYTQGTLEGTNLKRQDKTKNCTTLMTLIKIQNTGTVMWFI